MSQNLGSSLAVQIDTTHFHTTTCSMYVLAIISAKKWRDHSRGEWSFTVLECLSFQAFVPHIKSCSWYSYVNNTCWMLKDSASIKYEPHFGAPSFHKFDTHKQERYADRSQSRNANRKFGIQCLFNFALQKICIISFKNELCPSDENTLNQLLTMINE